MIDSSYNQQDLPELLSEKVLAQGNWHYNQTETFAIRLLEAEYKIGHCDKAQLSQNHLFTTILESSPGAESCTVYYWDFSNLSRSSCSPGFSTRKEAMDYIRKYQGIELPNQPSS
ncbi:MAG: hypothetical protein KKI09_06570 [Spirochaetes bacterium]|nr:hypothetical protein [Spirochaetota bacterium]